MIKKNGISYALALFEHTIDHKIAAPVEVYNKSQATE